MSTPPPPPPDLPIPPGTPPPSGPVSLPPPVLSAAREKPVGSRLERKLGDLSDAEIAALLPPEEDEDEILPPGKAGTVGSALHAPPPPPPGGEAAKASGPGLPPIQGAIPPPSPVGSQGVVSLVPPPAAGEDVDEEDHPAPSPRPKGLTSQQKTLIAVLGASAAVGLLIVVLALVFSPERNRRIDPNAPAMPEETVEADPVKPKSDRPEDTLDLRGAEDIQFVEAEDEESY